ncbi:MULTISPECIES: putative bifunctional diguanylate cyclase/phosphodiesterase [Methylobacterium]|uniref:putative bifunctional diguanylate cyclase/phosphodiesterase n=1 Tax=Methylobacterium TaxID=407 RepID=UPI0013ED429C|nr:EAL domain-containing protein [Methylobacterium sp. DB0501]NGM36003.1 EAL domain-containing protein [Methylobacterium sp. DB0501]
MKRCASTGVALAPAEGPLGPISFSQICDVMPIGVMTCDLATFTIDYANPSSIALLHSIRGTLGIDPDRIVGTSIDIFHPNPGDQRDLLSQPGNLPHKTRMRFGDEWLDLSIHALPGPDGRVGRALLVWSIATAEVLKGQEEYRLLRMIDDMPVAVMTVDPATYRITYINETSKRTLSQIEAHLPIKARDLMGASIDVFHRHPTHQRRLLADPANLPHHARIKVGPEVLDLQASAVRGTDGTYLGPMLTWSIVTQQVAAEARIHQLAHYDTLTGLANRSTFRERLEAVLAREGSALGLLFIDLDGFKVVNDSNGHLVGDALLCQVADRLRALCDQPGTVVSRLGGDEFAVTTPLTEPRALAAFADRLIDALVAPYPAEGERSLEVGASIGIAVAPEHGHEPEALLAHADMALYAAKAAGKRTYRLFCAEMETRMRDRLRIEAKLRAALTSRDELFLFYQPIIDVRTCTVTAREGLIRWHQPIRGWLSPGEFIPVAEESRLICDLGAWVLRRACEDAATWADKARVAVNVSPRQLGTGTLAPAVLEALLASGLPPDRLEIEVTESALLNDEKAGLADLRRIRDMGVRVALDDFGTGFSSLAHLRAFPFDKIKIDGSFVRDAVARPDCAAIVGVVADLGRRLGVTTVAEGVETQAHLDLVIAEGCSEVQGYLLGRPAPREADVAVIEGFTGARPARSAVA